MTTRLKIGECDACERTLPLRFVSTTHGEANVCAMCRGGDANDVWEEFVEYVEETFPGKVIIDDGIVTKQ